MGLVKLKSRGHWGQKRPTEDQNNYPGIICHPSLTRIHHQTRIYGCFSVPQSQITFDT